MADSNVTISVPTELNNLGQLAQAIVTGLRAGNNYLSVLGSALPVLFSEGAKWEDLKAEVMDPQAVVLAGLVIGELVASLIKKQAAPAAAPAVAAPAV